MLISRLFSGNRRLALAAENAPPMRRGETDHEAVRLLQQALRDLGLASMRRSIRADGTFDGDYAGETVAAVRKFQEDNALGGRDNTGDGIAGRDTIALLDRLALAAGLVPLTPAAAASAAPPVETPTTLALATPSIPSAVRLRTEYDRFVEVRGRPCNATRTNAAGDTVPITNQCAIRLSIALGRCGIGFHMRPAEGVRLFVHRAFSPACGGHIEVPHEARSLRLFNHIRTFWNFTTYRIGRGGVTGAGVYDDLHLRRQNAIIYFDDISVPTSPDEGGDHIDFFDGTRIMNDQLNYAAPGEPRGRNANTTFVATRTAIHVLSINP